MPAKKYFLVYVILPLLVGLAIYFLFRQNTLLHSFIDSGKMPLISPDNFFTKFIAYQLPDFCWTLSFSAALFLFQSYFLYETRAYFYFVMTISVAAEFAQLLFPHSFTFDVLDVGAAIAPVCLSYWMKPPINEKNT